MSSHNNQPDILRLETIEKRLTTVEKLLENPSSVDGGFYIHTQSIASATWIVNHNLGRSPAVRVIDTAGRTMDAEIEDINVNSLKVMFYLGGLPYSVIGKAYCT